MKSFVLETEIMHLLEEVNQAAKNSEELVMIDYGYTFDLIPKIKLVMSEPNRHLLRLTKEMIEDRYPLYKRADSDTKANFIKDIFKLNVNGARLERLNSFKQLLYRTIIISVVEHNGRYIIKTKKVRKINRL